MKQQKEDEILDRHTAGLGNVPEHNCFKLKQNSLGSKNIFRNNGDSVAQILRIRLMEYIKCYESF